MAKLAIKKDSTSVILYVFVQNSSVTTGAGLTGLAYNTASLVAYYVRPAAASAAITLATQTTTGAYSSGGFVEVDATNMPGIYRFDVPNAVIATGVNSVVVMLKGATNMVPVVLEIDLVAYDPQDTVRLGLTAMPNVASGSAGAIVTSGTGTAQLSVSSGLVTLAGVTHTGATIPTVTTTTTATNLTNLPGIPANWITAAGITAAALNGKGDWNVGKTGYSLTQTFPTNFSAMAITAGGALTAGTVSDKTGYSLSAAQTCDITGNLSGSVGSVTGAVGSVTGNVGGNVVGSVGSVTARVTANTDQINGVATSAARLALSTQGIVTGTVGAASTSTSIVTSALDPAAAVADQFKGRIVIFNQGTTTTNLRGQATDITASSIGGVLTVTALTTAPVSGDTFTII